MARERSEETLESRLPSCRVERMSHPPHLSSYAADDSATDPSRLYPLPNAGCTRHSPQSLRLPVRLRPSAARGRTTSGRVSASRVRTVFRAGLRQSRMSAFGRVGLVHSMAVPARMRRRARTGAWRRMWRRGRRMWCRRCRHLRRCRFQRGESVFWMKEQGLTGMWA